jgi:hypothetical protein
MRTTYTGPVKNRGEDAKGRARVSREELADFRRKHGADKTLRDLLNADKTGKTPASEKAPLARGPQGASIAPKAAAKPAGPRRDAAAEAKGAETLERMKSRAGRGMAVRSNEEMRDEAKGRTLGALGAAATMAGGPLARMAMGRAAPAAKAAPRVEPRVGRPVTTKLDDAAAAFSRPQARQASKDTGYTREAMPAKTAPKPTAAPKPREEVLKRQAAMREGRKSEEDYVRDVMERGAEMGMKRGGTAKAYAKGGSVKGGGCETRSKKTRFI